MKCFPGVQENAALTAKGTEFTSHCRRLQGSHRGSTNGNYPAVTITAVAYCCNGVLPYFQPFAVHFVLANIFRTNWLERAGSDVQGDLCGGNPHRPDVIQQQLVEVQPRCWSGHSSFPSRIDGLVAHYILLVIATIYVGG